MIKTIGLAYRARKVTIGTEFTVEGIRNKKVSLVFVASDASDNTKKLIYDKAKTYGVEVIELYDFKTISHAIGKQTIKVLGITDRGFSQLLINQKRK